MESETSLTLLRLFVVELIFGAIEDADPAVGVSESNCMPVCALKNE